MKVDVIENTLVGHHVFQERRTGAVYHSKPMFFFVFFFMWDNPVCGEYKLVQ